VATESSRSAHPEDRVAYGEHKAALAERGFADVTSYNNAKAGLIYEIYERIFAADSQHHHDPQPRSL
jgi:GrpB-like predicted nucleotidyltransferase (UPF0157 family)